MHIITIEGNIGSGKSTLMADMQAEFADNPRIIFIREPVDDWQTIVDCDGLNIIEKYYADQARYAFPFQMAAYISKFQYMIDARNRAMAAGIECPVFISERSLYTDRYVFAKMLADMGKIEPICFTVYLRWFNSLLALIAPQYSAIYVDTDPAACARRINIRKRDGEDLISHDYLTSCDTYHRDMLLDAASPFREVAAAIHIYDGNVEVDATDARGQLLAAAVAFVEAAL